jgi:hypothetical protein
MSAGLMKNSSGLSGWNLSRVHLRAALEKRVERGADRVVNHDVGHAHVLLYPLADLDESVEIRQVEGEGPRIISCSPHVCGCRI